MKNNIIISEHATIRFKQRTNINTNKDMYKKAISALSTGVLFTDKTILYSYFNNIIYIFGFSEQENLYCLITLYKPDNQWDKFLLDMILHKGRKTA